MRYELFNRLNTGGTVLTDQEIRNAIFRGAGNDFNIFLKSSASSNQFINLVGPTERQLEELYLDELVLRFCSLLDFNISENSAENISSHMTNYMKNAVLNKDIIPKLDTVFHKVVNILYPIGKNVFRGTNNVFSTSLYDCVMHGIAKNIDKYESCRTDEIIEKINKLKESENFKKASGSSSASKSRIAKRIEVAREIFD